MVAVCKPDVPAGIEEMGLGGLSTMVAVCKADTAAVAWVVEIFVAILTFVATSSHWSVMFKSTLITQNFHAQQLSLG